MQFLVTLEITIIVGEKHTMEYINNVEFTQSTYRAKEEDPVALNDRAVLP
jgi:hypothetical protein